MHVVTGVVDLRREKGRVAERGAAAEAGLEVDDAQLLYARVLTAGVTAAAVVLLATFALYVSGVAAPAVPLAELPKYWGLSAHEYLRATNDAFLHHDHAVTGWGWASVLGCGDYLCYLGIALLSAITVVCYATITVTLFKRRDLLYAARTLAEVGILTLAATGVLGVGGAG